MVRSSPSPICALTASTVTTATVAASIAPAPIATTSLAQTWVSAFIYLSIYLSIASLATTALRTLLGRFT